MACFSIMGGRWPRLETFRARQRKRLCEPDTPGWIASHRRTAAAMCTAGRYIAVVRVARWKRLSVGPIALVALATACGSDFYSTGQITSRSASGVCARFANSREECFSNELIDQPDSSLQCIRVHFEGESARPLDAEFIECDATSS
jgi:hypothetical protein